VQDDATLAAMELLIVSLASLLFFVASMAGGGGLIPVSALFAVSRTPTPPRCSASTRVPPSGDAARRRVCAGGFYRRGRRVDFENRI
jgi:hypothetical protein